MKFRDLMKFFALAAVSCACISGQLYAADDGDDEQVEEAPKKAKKKKAKKAPAPTRMIVAVDKIENKVQDHLNHNDGSLHVKAQQFDTLRARILHRVSGTRKFEVMEREQIKSAMSEQALANRGLTDGDAATAPESGKMKAAGYVLYGNVLFWGFEEKKGAAAGVASQTQKAKVELQLKITNAEDGKILSSKVVTGVGLGSQQLVESGASIEGNWNEAAMRDAVDNAAAMVVDALRDLCYPAKVVAVGKRNITVNMTAEEVKEGDVFDVIEQGDPMTDPDTGAFLGYDGDDLGRVKITRPGPMASKAEPEGDLDLDDVEVGCILRRVSPDKIKAEVKKIQRKKQAEFENRF